MSPTRGRRRRASRDRGPEAEDPDGPAFPCSRGDALWEPAPDLCEPRSTPSWPRPCRPPPSSWSQLRRPLSGAMGALGGPRRRGGRWRSDRRGRTVAAAVLVCAPAVGGAFVAAVATGVATMRAERSSAARSRRSSSPRAAPPKAIGVAADGTPPPARSRSAAGPLVEGAGAGPAARSASRLLRLRRRRLVVAAMFSDGHAAGQRPGRDDRDAGLGEDPGERRAACSGGGLGDAVPAAAAERRREPVGPAAVAERGGDARFRRRRRALTRGERRRLRPTPPSSRAAAA